MYPPSKIPLSAEGVIKRFTNFLLSNSDGKYQSSVIEPHGRKALLMQWYFNNRNIFFSWPACDHAAINGLLGLNTVLDHLEQISYCAEYYIPVFLHREKRWVLLRGEHNEPFVLYDPQKEPSHFFWCAKPEGTLLRSFFTGRNLDLVDHVYVAVQPSSRPDLSGYLIADIFFNLVIKEEPDNEIDLFDLDQKPHDALNKTFDKMLTPVILSSNNFEITPVSETDSLLNHQYGPVTKSGAFGSVSVF